MPELDDGAVAPLPSPELDELDDPELELDPAEPLPDEPEPCVPEPELAVPEDDLADDDAGPEDAALLCEPGRTRAMAPAVTTLASPTVTVVVWTRLCPRARDALARCTLSRSGAFITRSLLSASGNGLCTSSEPPMNAGRGAMGPAAGPFLR